MATNEPIHVAITRRVKPGYEAEFQKILREFLQASFAHSGVQGANMIIPLHGSSSPEFGILRTFANSRERDDFYKSPMFKAWEKRIKPMIEGDPVCHQFNGLEAWFRSPQNRPPVWKMAIATYLGVLPVIMGLSLTLGSLLSSWNFVLKNIVFNACVVALLTWIVMPLITHVLHDWLYSQEGKKS
jgi:antibiotic biosynthesis monooxygenase (ABM) superfamily enzyme